MTEKPVRLQLSRKRGFNLQALSQAKNGLQAVKVARPSHHGNKYRVGIDGTREECVAMFRADWEFGLSHALGRIVLQQSLDSLRGKNVACFCSVTDACHGDVLLELANSPTPQAQE